MKILDFFGKSRNLPSEDEKQDFWVRVAYLNQGGYTKAEHNIFSSYIKEFRIRYLTKK